MRRFGRNQRRRLRERVAALEAQLGMGLAAAKSGDIPLSDLGQVLSEELTQSKGIYEQSSVVLTVEVALSHEGSKLLMAYERDFQHLGRRFLLRDASLSDSTEQRLGLYERSTVRLKLWGLER